LTPLTSFFCLFGSSLRPLIIFKTRLLNYLSAILIISIFRIQLLKSYALLGESGCLDFSCIFYMSILWLAYLLRLFPLVIHGDCPSEHLSPEGSVLVLSEYRTKYCNNNNTKTDIENTNQFKTSITPITIENKMSKVM
jgi:hypothetical protein